MTGHPKNPLLESGGGCQQTVDYCRAVTCAEPSTLGLVQDASGVWQTPEGLANREATAIRLREARQRVGEESAA